jgi:hypothetical protein
MERCEPSFLAPHWKLSCRQWKDRFPSFGSHAGWGADRLQQQNRSKDALFFLPVILLLTENSRDGQTPRALNRRVPRIARTKAAAKLSISQSPPQRAQTLESTALAEIFYSVQQILCCGRQFRSIPPSQRLLRKHHSLSASNVNLELPQILANSPVGRSRSCLIVVRAQARLCAAATVRFAFNCLPVL